MAAKIEWRDLSHGIVIGVTVAIIMGVFGQIEEHCQKGRKIRYIREIVTTGTDRMNRAAPRIITQTGECIEAHQMRYEYFVNLSEGFISALDNYAERIPYRDTYELRDAFITAGRAFESSINKGIPLGKHHYELLVDTIRNTKWLRVNPEWDTSQSDESCKDALS